MPFIKKIFRPTLCLAVLFWLLLSCLYFARGPLGAFLVRTYLLPELKEQGVTLSFTHLDTNLFSSLTLSGLSLKVKIPAVATISGDAASATLQFNAAALWHDLRGGLAASTLRIDGANLRCTLDEQPKSIPPDKNFFAGFLPALPYGVPSLSLRKCMLKIEGRAWHIELDGLTSAGLRPIGGKSGGLTGSLTVAAIRQQGLPFFAQRRNVQVDFTYGSGRLTLSALSIAGEPVLRDIEVNASAGGLQAVGSLELAGGMIDFKLDGKGTVLQGFIKSRDLQMGGIGSILARPPAVHGTLALQSTFRLDLRHPETASAALRLRLENGKVATIPIGLLRVELNLDRGELTGREICLKNRANQATLTGIKTNLADLLQGRYWQAVRSGKADFDLSIGEWRQFAHFLPRQVVRALADSRCRQVRLHGALQDARLDVSAFSAYGKEFEVELKQGSVLRLPSVIQDWRKAEVRADVAFVLGSIAPIRTYLPASLQRLKGKVGGSAFFVGSFAHPGGRLSVNGAQVRYQSMPVFDFKAEANLANNTVRLTKFSATAGSNRLAAEGRLPLSTTRPFELKAEGQVAQLADFSDLFLPQAEATGDLSFSLTVRGTFKAPQGALELHSKKLSIAGYRLEKTSLAAFYDGKTVRISALRFTGEGAEFLLAGRLTARQRDWQSLTAELASFQVLWRGQRLRLLEPVRLTYAAQTLSLLESVRLDSELGPVTVRGSAGKSRLALKLDAAALRMPVGVRQAKGKDELAFSKASLSLMIDGSPAAPVITGRGRVSGLHDPALPAATFAGEAAFRYNDHGLILDNVQFNGKPGGRVSLHGQLPVVFRQGKLVPLPSPLFLAAEVALPDATLIHLLFPQYIAKVKSLHGEIRLHGTLRKPLGHAEFEVQGVQTAASLDWLPPGVLNADMRLQAEAKRLRVETFRIEGERMQVVLDGLVLGNLSLADLLRPEYRKPAAELDLHGKLQLPTLTWLTAHFKAIRRVSGQLAGDFSLRGAIRHPEVKADLQITDGELRSGAELPALRGVSGKISVDDNGVTIAGFTGLIGGAPAKASGRLLFVGKKGPSLDLRLAGKNLLLYRTDDVKLRADADITIKGPYKAPIIEGTLALTEGYYNKNIHLLKMITAGISPTASALPEHFTLFSLTEEPLKDAKFALSIRSEAPFTINTNLLKGSLRPNLRLIGTGELPQLVGVVYVDDARCSLPAGPLRIDTGLLRFRQADPDRFYLELSGSAKMMGYDITAKINGPYDEPTINLSSDPPLGNEELLLLLLTGQRPASGNGLGRSGAQMSRVGLYLGRGLLTSLFGKEYVDEQNILERLQIDIGREITRQGDDTIEAKFLLKDGFLRPNDALYLTAEKDVWDDYNGGLRLVFRFP